MIALESPLIPNMKDLKERGGSAGTWGYILIHGYKFLRWDFRGIIGSGGKFKRIRPGF
jgi:hypothetical protein